MTAILKEEPAGITDARTGISPELDRVIARCLENKAEQRFQSAPDLAFTLRSILAESGEQPPPQRSGPVAGQGGDRCPRRRRLDRRRIHGSARARSCAATRATIDSIAVLPLENCPATWTGVLCRRMTEALISDLAKIGGLKVISRTSVMRYKATTKSLPEIAKELNVDAVVEGSVLWVGDRVRITAQLIHAATDEHLWSESYDRDLRDVLRLHSEVARTIAQEIKVTLTPQVQARMVEARPINPEAYQAYLKGRFNWHNRERAGMQKAIEYFRRAIELDPNYAPAYAGMADSYTQLARNGHLSPKEAFPLAKRAALKAVELEDTLAEGHGALAFIALYFDWDWTVAERELLRALDRNPSYEEAHHQYSHLLLTVGKPGESLTESQRALELNPLDLLLNVHLGWHYMMSRQYDKAIAQLKSVLEMDPNHYLALRHIGWAYMYNGRHADSIAALEAADKSEPDNSQAMAALATAYAAGGRGSDARALLGQLEGSLGQRYVSACDIAAVYAALNEADVALDWLEKAYEERSPRMVELGLDPVFDPLRSDPRFTDLLRRIGLPPLAPMPSKGSSSKPPDGKIMLAVLPFENLSRDPEQEYFSDGLTEEMIAQLGRLNPQKLGVIARTSAMHYKNTDRAIDRVRRELGVDYVVEGSVRRAENRVRITAKLIQCTDQAQLWANNFERELKDILALQSNVAQAIAQEIKVTLTPQEHARMDEARPVNPEAHQAYLKGRFYWNKRTPDGVKKAVEYFEQAVSLDPDWPLGHLGLADAYAVASQGAMRPHEAIPKAKAAAAKALELDESLGEAHATLGFIAESYDWDRPTAQREFERALALSPNYATAHHWYAWYLGHAGRLDEALKEMKKAQELDPLSLIISGALGSIQLRAGHLDEAERGLRKTLELGPDFPIAHMILTMTLFLQGRNAEAIAEAREAVRLSDNASNPASILAYLYAKTGQPEEARRILDELTDRSTKSYVAPTAFVRVYAGLGETDTMFKWLEKACQERDAALLNVLFDPFLAPMRGDPRFIDLVRRVGLPDSMTPINPKDRLTTRPSP
jgi:TolB-like protein/Tfp pilus assembly protein PilF